MMKKVAMIVSAQLAIFAHVAWIKSYAAPPVTINMGNIATNGVQVFIMRGNTTIFFPAGIVPPSTAPVKSHDELVARLRKHFSKQRPYTSAARKPSAVDLAAARGMQWNTVKFPWVVVPLVLMAYPAWCCITWLRHRPSPQQCKCGYNLTGNTSGTCPECGVRICTANS